MKFNKIFSLLLFLSFLFIPTQLGKHFWPDYSYLYGLKIDYLSPTIYLQDILVWLLFIFSILKGDFRRLKINKILVFFLTLFVSANIVLAILPQVALLKWLRLFEGTLFAVVIYRNKQESLGVLIKVIPLWVVFEFLVGLSQIYRQSSIGGIFWFFGERNINFFTPGIAKASFWGVNFLRPYGTFSHPNSLSGFIFVCLIFLIFLENQNVFTRLAQICSVLLIIMCFSRVIWFLTFLLFFSLFLIKTKERINLIKKNSFLMYLLLSATVLLFLYLFTQTTISSSSYDIRVKLAQASVLVFKSRILIGVGLGNFIVSLSQNYNNWDYLYWLQPVHNIFLLIGSETGLIGLLLFVGLIVLIIRRSLYRYIAISKNKRDNEITRYQTDNNKRIDLVLLISLFAIIFSGLFDHYWLTLIQNQLLFVVILALAW